jgi:glycerate-2-kinase
MLIKNFNELALSSERKTLLEVLNFGLENLNIENEIEKLKLKEGFIFIENKIFNLEDFSRIVLVGFGKGSFYIASSIHKILLERKNFLGSFVIDFKYDNFYFDDKFYFFEGDHPLVTERNILATKKIIEFLKELNLKENDLVIVIICGGGSSMFEIPVIDFSKLVKINQKLLTCGANIYEVNTIRKHLSFLKGGSFLKILYPAKVISFIVSDVVGDDISIVASGPTCFDNTTKEDALKLIKNYNIEIEESEIIETPKEKKFFENVFNFILFNNLKILKKMEDFAKSLKIEAEIISSKVNESTEEFSQKSLEIILKLKKGIYIFGGETTLCVKKPGKGGRNQDLALRVLKILKEKNLKNIVFLAFNSDGWDNSEFGGAIVDQISLYKAEKMNLDINYFLNENLSFYFFEKTKDYILTGRLPINVADFILIYKTAS